MGWLDAALTVATTIGKIAGSLVGGKELVHFGPVGTGTNVTIGQVVFWVSTRDNHIWVLNQSTDSGAQVYFPGGRDPRVEPSAVQLPEGTKFDLTKAFNIYSLGDVDDLVITPWDQKPPRSGANGEDEVNLQAQGNNVQPNIEVSLGPYFKIKVNASDRTILITVLGGLALTGIVLLNVHGAGSTFARIANVVRPKDVLPGDDSMVVEVPAGVDVAAGLQSIEIIATVTGIKMIMDRFTQDHPGLLQPLSPEDLERLAAYREG
ncbi:hypothetical protein [Nonomuraea wenchangensis]